MKQEEYPETIYLSPHCNDVDGEFTVTPEKVDTHIEYVRADLVDLFYFRKLMKIFKDVRLTHYITDAKQKT